MKRLAPILFYILIGAITVSSILGYYLTKANTDRERLSALINQATVEKQNAETESQRAIQEANKTVEDAKAHVEEVKAKIALVQHERDLIIQAKVLSKPLPSSIRGWLEAADVELGISVKYPPTSNILTNTSAALTIGSGENQWFHASAYDANVENQLVAGLTNPTDVLFLQQERLLQGSAGTDSEGHSVYVLKLLKNGVPDKLVWARDQLNPNSKHILLSTLATLQFAD